MKNKAHYVGEKGFFHTLSGLRLEAILVDDARIDKRGDAAWAVGSDLTVQLADDQRIEEIRDGIG